MNLKEKILQLNTNLTDDDFGIPMGTIRIQNDSDGRGEYIKSWNHPTETQPTEEELNGIN